MILCLLHQLVSPHPTNTHTHKQAQSRVGACAHKDAYLPSILKGRWTQIQVEVTKKETKRETSKCRQGIVEKGIVV